MLNRTQEPLQGEENLPSKQEAFSDLLEKPFLRWHSKADRYRIKLAVETIAQKNQKRLNDVLDHYGINRAVYFDYIDPLTEADAELMPSAPKQRTTKKDLRRNSSVFDLMPAEQLTLLEQVDELISLSGFTVDEACRQIGIYETQYRKLERNRETLRGRMKTEQGKETTDVNDVVRGRKHVEAPEMRRVIFDAAIVLSQATRHALGSTVRDLGITLLDFNKWQESQNIEPIFPFHKGPKRKLTASELKIGTEEKVRLVRAINYLQHETAQTREEISRLLGYREGTVEEWMDIVRAVSQVRRQKRRERTNVVYPAEMETLIATSKKDAKSLQPWLRAFKLRDALAQILLPESSLQAIKVDDHELLHTWSRVWEAQDERAMEILMSYYEPLVVKHANNYKRKLPSFVSVDDLVTSGRKGLLDAIKRYKLGHSSTFDTFSALRILGEMKDYIRMTDWVPRSVRAIQHKVAAARQVIRRRDGEDVEPSVEVMAEEMKVTVPRARQMMSTAAPREIISLDAELSTKGEGEGGTLHDVIGKDDDIRLRDEDRDAVMRALLLGLSDVEQKLIRMYYLEGMTMREVGEELDLSESRISQLHADLLVKMKEKVLAHAGMNDTLGYIAQLFGFEAEDLEECA